MDQQVKSRLSPTESRCGFQVVGAEAEVIEGYHGLRNKPAF